MDSFFKNLSIMGGFLPLYITGTGKDLIDLIGLLFHVPLSFTSSEFK